MDCDKTRDQLSALVDGQLDVDSRRMVEDHLAGCAECRSERDALESLDAVVLRAFRDERRRADAVADRVLQQWRGSHPTPRRSGAFARRWAGYCVAAAVGFLAATMLFQLVGNDARRIAIQDVPVAPGVPVAATGDKKPIVARLVHATGSPLFRRQTTDEWQPVTADQVPNFSCPSDSEVRTESGALCELHTSTGGRIRLNEQSEIGFVDTGEIELKTGQVWCRGPDEGSHRIVAHSSVPPETTNAENAVRSQWTIVCPTQSECVASFPASGPARVVAVFGAVEVTVDGTPHQVGAGTSCSTSNGTVTVAPSGEEWLTASRWMQPLLTLEGHASPELTGRVDALLARIGRTKISYLFEQDIRNLGEYGALPLLRFVQAADAVRERERRQTATRILVDTAPIWMAPELIDLLDDSDPALRVLVARTLTRLTRETQGLSPDDWQADRARWGAGVDGWRKWWATHNLSCSPPPAGVQMRAPKQGFSEPSQQNETPLKARN